MKRWKIIEADADDESAMTSRELFKVAVAFKDSVQRDPSMLDYYASTRAKLVPAIEAAINDMSEDDGTD